EPSPRHRQRPRRGNPRAVEAGAGAPHHGQHGRGGARCRARAGSRGGDRRRSAREGRGRDPRHRRRCGRVPAAERRDARGARGRSRGDRSRGGMILPWHAEGTGPAGAIRRGLFFSLPAETPLDAPRRKPRLPGEQPFGARQMTDTAVLFEPFQSARLTLPNRIVMAPMTRNMAPGGVPGQANADYYRRRAEGGVGLILSEGTVVNRPASRNLPHIPFFHGKEPLGGWKGVIDAVHAAGGKMGPQIWHTGGVPTNDPGFERPALDTPSGLNAPGQLAG